MCLLRKVAFALVIVFLYDYPMYQIFVLLATSVVYNVTLAISQPFYRTYNMILHYFNEIAFFLFLIMCLVFTEFIIDIPTRVKTASGMSIIMFAVLCVNVLFCFFAIVIWGYEKFRPLIFQKQSASIISE